MVLGHMSVMEIMAPFSVRKRPTAGDDQPIRAQDAAAAINGSVTWCHVKLGDDTCVKASLQQRKIQDRGTNSSHTAAAKEEIGADVRANAGSKASTGDPDKTKSSVAERPAAFSTMAQCPNALIRLT